jgi:ribosomal-protein-alanine N-acetyltransferase
MERWPLLISDHELTLRSLRYRDRGVWREVRQINAAWLAPWEATRPTIESDLPRPTFPEMVRHYNREAKEFRSFSFAIWIKEGKQDHFIGQITLGGVILGAYRGAHIGYWIDQRFANRGYTTRAVRQLTNFAFSQMQLHRIEINLRPENVASRKVAEKSGYTLEGIRPRYLHIAGDWRDHLTFVAENPNNFN